MNSTAKNLVSISGQVIRPAIYEIKENTTLGNVINLAGGLSPKAYQDQQRSKGLR